MNDTNSTNFSCLMENLNSENVSNTSFWEINDQENKVVVTVVGVLLVLFCTVGTIWNLFIIITFFIKHELLKEPANVFLLNVAITDLLTCTTTMVFTFVTDFNLEFVFGNNDVTRCVVCKLSGFFLVYLVELSLHLLMALSIDRFILLSRPLRYKRLMNRWKAIGICALLHVVSLILAILPLVGFGEYEFNVRFGACVFRFTPFSNLLYVILLLVEVMIPVVSIGLTNVWTYRLVSKFLKRNFRRRSTFRRNVEKGGNKEEQQKHQKQQKQLVKVFGALLIASIITYTPTIITMFVFIILSLNDREDSLPGVLYVIGYVSFLTSAVFHPIIESFFVKELRYQVNRAKKGVRRISTSIYRQTTSYFSNKTLDEAAQKADDASIPTAKRPIRFLNGKVVSEPKNESMVTEMEELGSHERSSSPSVNSAPKTPEFPRAAGKDSNGVVSSERPMLTKARRSVTFQENITDVPRASLTTPTSCKSAELSEQHAGARVEVVVEEEHDTSKTELIGNDQTNETGHSNGKGYLDAKTTQ